ncbi:MAG TPA: hypothetical protein VH518_06790 [Tepidisphaeraceae bacterium]
MPTGCAQPEKPGPPTVELPPFALTQGRPSNAPRDPSAATPSVFHVEVFILSAPMGTFSGNESLWKRIDEQCLDPGTSDLLQKNGFRVGVAPVGELEGLAQYMQDAAPVQSFSVAGAEMKDVEVEMKTNVPEQVIFYFNKQNVPVGNTYDKSENLMNVSFEPAPRKPGTLRMKFCPMVRELKKKMQFTPMNDSYDIQFVNPEKYYDLNFVVDIPSDSFLLVTPSTSASLPSIIGRGFLIKDSPTEMQEQMLLIVPQSFHPSPKSSRQQQPQAAPQKKK